MTPPFNRGQVVWVAVPDPQGRNPKERPCVVVGCSETHVAVIGVTSTLDLLDAADRVDLPFSKNPAAPCHTGLKRPSAANCHWREVVNAKDVVCVMGQVLPEHLERILARVRELTADSPAR